MIGAMRYDTIRNVMIMGVVVYSTDTVRFNLRWHPLYLNIGRCLSVSIFFVFFCLIYHASHVM